MVSCDAPIKSSNVILVVRYRVTRASGSNHVVKKAV